MHSPNVSLTTPLSLWMIRLTIGCCLLNKYGTYILPLNSELKVLAAQRPAKNKTTTIIFIFSSNMFIIFKSEYIILIFYTYSDLWSLLKICCLWGVNIIFSYDNPKQNISVLDYRTSKSRFDWIAFFGSDWLKKFERKLPKKTIFWKLVKSKSFWSVNDENFH